MKSLAGFAVFCVLVYGLLEVAAVAVHIPSFAPILAALTQQEAIP